MKSQSQAEMEEAMEGRKLALLKKLAAGKLTPEDRKDLALLSKSGATGMRGQKYAISKSALARALDTTEATIRNMCKKDGNPGRTVNGYDVEAWKAWFPTVAKQNGGAHVTLAELPDVNKIAAARAAREFEEWEFDQAVKRGKYILKEEVKRQASACDAVVIRELRQRFLIVAPGESEQCSNAEEIRAVNQRHIDELMEFMYSGEW